MAFHPMILSGFQNIQTDPGDTRFNNFVQEHLYQTVFGHQNLWNPQFFYPTKNLLAYSEVQMGMAPLYWPWRVLGIAPDSSFQIFMFLLLALDFIFFEIFLRRAFGIGKLASSVGAFLFAFGSPRVVQAGHQQLLQHFYTVLSLIALVEIFKNHHPKTKSAFLWSFLFFLGIVGQLYSCFYLGWYFGISLGIALIVGLVLPTTRSKLIRTIQTHFIPMGASALLALVALYPLVSHFMEAAKVLGPRSSYEIHSMLPNLQSWLWMGNENWLYGWTRKVRLFQVMGMEHEKRIGIGLLTTILVFLGIKKNFRHPLVKISVITAFVWLFFASVLPHGYTLWDFFTAYIPAGKAIRAVSRIGIFLLIPWSIGLALMIERLEMRKKTVVALVLSLFCCLEQGQTTGSYNKFRIRKGVDEITDQLNGCKVFYYSPIGRDQSWVEFQIDAMFASLKANVPTINGYSGSSPPQFGPLVQSYIESSADRTRISQGLDVWALTKHINRNEICWIKTR